MTLNGLFNLTHSYTNLKCGSRLECQGALGMESRAITDGQISASTIWSSRHFPSNARLHNQASANSSGAWEPSKKNANQWLQIDLVTQLSVTRVATQGRPDGPHWVTKYHLQYSNNGSTFQFHREQGKHFSKVSHWADIWTCSLFNTMPCWPQTWSITYVCCLKELSGNTDGTTVVSHDLIPPIMARYIRFRPLAWHLQIAMRVELYGCQGILESLKAVILCNSA